MKTLHISDEAYYNVCYNSQLNKMNIIKTNTNIFTDISDDNWLEKDDNLICVFVINPVLVGMLRTLSIPFYKAKNLISKAIFKDVTEEKMFNKNSNLYNLLINEFHLPIKTL
jgi:hypothetical protein